MAMSRNKKGNNFSKNEGQASLTPDPLTRFDNLGLGSLDEKQNPVKSRLKDVKSAIEIYQSLRRADEGSSLQRARVDAMFDGVPPYDQSKLEASGQGLKTNLNFGESQRLLDISLSAYVDLYSSLERFVDVVVTEGELAERMSAQEIISEELTHLLRSWPEFHSSYLRLCNTFVKHGVGISYFDNPTDWKFRVGGLEDILIPRQSPATEEGIDVAIIRREYHLHELNAFIQNEGPATKKGWDVPEVKRVMLANARTDGRTAHRYSSGHGDFEALQASFKNNDLYIGFQNPTVSVLHFLVREMDGTLSHYMCTEDQPKSFMYSELSRYKDAEEAFVFFSLGVGSNGTYHSVRGLGQRIFAHIQTSNRLRCQMVDGAMIGSTAMIQPEDQRALEELDFTFYGSYAVISPNVNFVERPIANLGTAVKPALDDLSRQLAMNTDVVSTYGPEQSSPYRNQMQVVADMDVATRLSGATLNLFYSSWGRLLREMTKRIVAHSGKDKQVLAFFRRCEERGVPASVISSIDTSKTKAVRAIGNGSQANRLVALRELQGIQGQFDETGRRKLTRDIVSTRVGPDFADRYAPDTGDQRKTVDDKVVFFENQQLMQGGKVPVFETELHGVHLIGHSQMLDEILSSINSGEADPVEAMAPLQALYEHISQTIQLASADPSLKGSVSAAKQSLQYAEEVINNTTKHIESEQRKNLEAQRSAQGDITPEEAEQLGLTPEELAEMQAMQAQGGGPAQPPQNDPAYEAHLVKMTIMKEKAALDLKIKRDKFQQEQSLRDATAALKFREENT
ncbi:MAG: hypothetical protein CMA72_07750 [Euryarchaeota archaeon]|nr:hypothetical protein [Euryarchaeota archaeon]